MNYSETERYRDYYASHPDLEEKDHAFRDAPQGEFFDQLLENRLVDETFGLIAELRPLVRGTVCTDRPVIDPVDAALYLKHNARKQGAVLTGVAGTREEFVYSVRGRGVRYGVPVEVIHPRTIIFAFEMDKGRNKLRARAPAECRGCTYLFEGCHYRVDGSAIYPFPGMGGSRPY